MFSSFLFTDFCVILPDFYFTYNFLQKFNYFSFKLLNFNRLILISLDCFLFLFFFNNCLFKLFKKIVFSSFLFTYFCVILPDFYFIYKFLQKFNYSFFKLLNFNRLILIFLDCLVLLCFFLNNKFHF